MAVVMNCLDESQTIRVGGNDFYFKPREIKYFYQEKLAYIIANERKEYGFIGLPEELADKEAREAPAAKALIEDLRKKGVEAFCTKLRNQIYNLQVSLKKDLDMSNLKMDPRVLASKGDLQAMELLLKYQSKHEDADQERINKIKDLEKKLQEK